MDCSHERDGLKEGYFFFGGQGTPDDTQINPPPRESNKQQITQKALMRVWWIHTIPYSP